MIRIKIEHQSGNVEILTAQAFCDKIGCDWPEASRRLNIITQGTGSGTDWHGTRYTITDEWEF